ncbi:MAG TPA: AAA family ATPase [Dehalococcoidia bacterium]|nr:AAA family ATPase [Dehalococcoidia bacterium]
MARVPEVLVVDQDPKARFEVKRLVKQVSLNIAGEAGFGTEAVSLASDKKPDVIICGMASPPDRSIRTMEALLDVLPETPIIAYGWSDNVETVRQAMVAGARDFFVMPADSERVLQSIKQVLESEEKKKLRLSGQAKSMGPRGLVIAVFGAKGGVGKTTIATNLGVALCDKLQQSAVLVDADNSFGDVAGMLDMRPDRTIIDIVRDVDTVDRDNVTDYLTKHSSGLWVLPAPRESLLWRSVTPDRFRRALGVLSRRFDIVLIDTAGVLNDLSLASLEEANMVLWVTSSDFSSINNSMIGLETLGQLSYPEARIRLMLNVISADDGVRPSKIEEVLGRQFFWSIPYDRQVRNGGQIGKPAVIGSPESRGAKSVIDLAEALIGGSAPRPEPKPKSSGLRRIFTRKTAETPAEPAAEGS